MTVRVAAVDLGATSGRVLAVRVGPGVLVADEIHRFATPLSAGNDLRWDFTALADEMERGLAAAAATGPVDAVGVDSWAVDYGLLDSSGTLMADPYCYRDDRTADAPEKVFVQISREELYARTGIQHQRFNTVFQLAVEAPSRLAAASRLLMVPDLLAHRLTGVASAEVTNASSTCLVDPSARTWDRGVLAALGLPRDLFTEPVEPGTVIGGVTAGVAARTGLCSGTPVVAVGTHDTASAVAAVPALRDDFAYVSSGTWSLVGLELEKPVRTEAARVANATNELGVDGTVRFLRNTTGLWLLSECRRQWAREGLDRPLDELLAAAAASPPLAAVVDADDERFLAPCDMAARIAAAAAERGPAPVGVAAMVRCVLDSLALATARSVTTLAAVAGRDVGVVHVVGGGSLNRLLCRLTADACGVPVVAGPAEAASLGNALVAARALGAVDGGLPALRELVAATQPLATYTPNPEQGEAR